MREQRQKCYYCSSIGVESRTSTVVESKTRLTSKRNFVLDSTIFLNFPVPDSTKSSKIACLCSVMVTFGLGGCSVPAGVISSCIKGTRIYVLSPTFKQSVFSTDFTGRTYVRPLVMFAFLRRHLRLTHWKVCCVLTLRFSSSVNPNCLPPIWLENSKKIRISGCMTIIAMAKNFIARLPWIRRLLLAPLLVLSLPSCRLPCRQLEGDNHVKGKKVWIP